MGAKTESGTKEHAVRGKVCFKPVCVYVER